MAAGSSGQPKAPVIVPGLFLFRRSLVAFPDDGLLLVKSTWPNCGRVMKLMVPTTPNCRRLRAALADKTGGTPPTSCTGPRKHKGGLG